MQIIIAEFVINTYFKLLFELNMSYNVVELHVNIKSPLDMPIKSILLRAPEIVRNLISLR